MFEKKTGLSPVLRVRIDQQRGERSSPTTRLIDLPAKAEPSTLPKASIAAGSKKLRYFGDLCSRANFALACALTVLLTLVVIFGYLVVVLIIVLGQVVSKADPG